MKYWCWIPVIIGLVYEFNGSNPSGLVATPEILSNMLWVRLGAESAPTSRDVDEALTLLSTAAVGAFQSDPDGNDGYMAN